MKIIYILPVFLFIQCVNNHKKDSELICQDTIYIEVAPVIEKKPWDLTCYDDAETNLELNICSLKCLEIADSLYFIQYQKLMSNLDKGISETYISEYHQDLKRQKRRIHSLNYAFSELEIALERLIDHSLGTARLRPLMCNTYLLNLKEFKLETFARLEEEIIHNF